MVLTACRFCVNEKYELVSTRVFNRVHAVHKQVTGFGAAYDPSSPQIPLWTRLLGKISRMDTEADCRAPVIRFCENRAKHALGKGFAVFPKKKVSFFRGSFYLNGSYELNGLKPYAFRGFAARLEAVP